MSNTQSQGSNRSQHLSSIYCEVQLMKQGFHCGIASTDSITAYPSLVLTRKQKHAGYPKNFHHIYTSQRYLQILPLVSDPNIRFFFTCELAHSSPPEMPHEFRRLQLFPLQYQCQCFPFQEITRILGLMRSNFSAAGFSK